MSFEIETDEQPRLLKILTLNRIAIAEESMSWTDSICFAGESLIRAGSIIEKYLDVIMSLTVFKQLVAFSGSRAVTSGQSNA